MRRDDHRRQGEQRRVDARLRGEHVEGGAGDAPRRHRLGQGRLVDDAAPGRVDDPEVGLGLGQQIGADQAHGLGRLGQVDGQEVGLAHHLLQREQLDAHLLGPLRRHVGVEGHQAHPEGVGPLGHEGADPAQADHAEGLAVQLDTLPAGALPLARLEGGVGLGDVAGLGEQQGHGVLGRREDVGPGGVDDHDAPAGGGGHVDVVEADPGPARPRPGRCRRRAPRR